MARNRVVVFFFLEPLLFLETKNSFICPTLWSHRYLELLNFGNEEEMRRKLGEGHKTGLGEKGRAGGKRTGGEREKAKKAQGKGRGGGLTLVTFHPRFLSLVCIECN